MTREKALGLAVAAFVLFAVVVGVLFALLDVRMSFLPGPLAGVAIACGGVYVAARRDRPT